MIKAALFDLDGVVFETESQYSIFWGKIGREYHPEIPDFEYRIKGQTLVQIYDKYFSEDSVFAHIEGYIDPKSEQDKITARLNEFEQNMKYPYIPGVENFIKELKQNGVKCAVVTSSNIQKMLNVYKQYPEFKGYFDRVLTSEDFAKSRLLSQGCRLLRRAAIRVRRPGRQLQWLEGSTRIGSIHPRSLYYQFCGIHRTL